MRGLLIGALALGIGGTVAWLAFNDDADPEWAELPDGYASKVNGWGVANNASIDIAPLNMSPRLAGNGFQVLVTVGNLASDTQLILFPSTNTMHVATQGYPIDEVATASWRAYQAASARNASTVPNASIIRNFQPL